MSAGPSVEETPKCVSIVRWASGVIRITHVPVWPVAGGTSMDTPSRRMSSRQKRPNSSAASFSRVRGFSAQVGDADDRVGRRAARTAMNGRTVQAAEHLLLRRLVDQGHRPLGEFQAFERGLADLGLNVNQ